MSKKEFSVKKWGWKRYVKATISYLFPVYIFFDLDKRITRLEELHGVPKDEQEKILY